MTESFVRARIAAQALSPLVLWGLAVACAAPLSDDEKAATADRPHDPYAATLTASVAQMHEAGITGVLAEVSHGTSKVRARAGAARTDRDAPVPWRASFRMGSNTKTFVAVVTLQLVGEGRLALEDSVEHWLPGVVHGQGYRPNEITIRHLLQHTSGIPEYTGILFSDFTPEGYDALRYRHFDPLELVEMALESPPSFAPGASWSYSNTNYILAGMIVEKIAGRPWALEVRDRILRPLGLRHTEDPGDRLGFRGPHASSYQQFAPDGDWHDVTRSNATIAGAAGSLISTTDDLTAFWRALLRGALLRPAEQAELRRTVLATTFQDVLPGLRYGLGIMQFPSGCERPYWGHPGDMIGSWVRNAVADDGSRAAVVSLSSRLFPGGSDANLPVEFAALELFDAVLCPAP